MVFCASKFTISKLVYLEKTYEQFMEEHFANDSKLLDDVKLLEVKHRLKLLSKLHDDKNEKNFYSWISEMRFGLYFDSFCSKIHYNEKIADKTPDWIIEMNEQRIITDVLRINTEEDELKEQIKIHKYIRTLRKENQKESFIIRARTKVMSSEYLYGQQNKLEAKEIKYRNIVETIKMPFIICVACTQDTFLDSLDFFDFFIGHSKRGFFYNGNSFGKNVTGILIRTYYSELKYFHNENAGNKLSQKNYDHFSTIMYEEPT